jgi:hypothetical protein
VNIVWFGLGFVLGLLVMKYMENKEFKDKINDYIRNLFKKRD